MPGWAADVIPVALVPAELAIPLLQALGATALAAAVAVPLGVALARLPAAWTATLATLALVLPLLPLPGAVAPAAPLVAFVALPLGWGLRRIPAATLRVAASLAGPGRVVWHVWLPLGAPWLLAGLGLGLARALAGLDLAWPAALLLAAAAWPVLRAAAARAG
jgi:hypothetical protein